MVGDTGVLFKRKGKTGPSAFCLQSTLRTAWTQVGFRVFFNTEWCYRLPREADTECLMGTHECRHRPARAARLGEASGVETLPSTLARQRTLLRQGLVRPPLKEHWHVLLLTGTLPHPWQSTGKQMPTDGLSRWLERLVEASTRDVWCVHLFLPAVSQSSRPHSDMWTLQKGLCPCRFHSAQVVWGPAHTVTCTWKLEFHGQNHL